MPIWSDFFKLFAYSGEKDPLSARKDPRQFPSAGIGSPEALGTDFQNGGGGGGQTSYRQTNDMIDTTTLSNRGMRYKEYDRLRNVPEIEMAMTVFADEACVAGDTKIATPFGFVTIQELAEKRGEDRFLVYCYDFQKNDYTLGWAFNPRLVKEEETVTITLDNGTTFTATHDHRVLKRDGTWINAGKLTYGDELMPFYRKTANQSLSKQRHSQYPRLFSFHRGWINERQFLDDWKSGKTDPKTEKVNRAMKMIGAGLGVRTIAEKLEHDWKSIEDWIQKAGFSHRETKVLYKNEDRRKVVGIHESGIKKVYDISVEKHKCFATDNVILHNCQKDEDGHIFKVLTGNDEIREEIEFLLLHRKMLNMNRNGWTWFKNLCIAGDWFVEMVINPDNPKEGIYRTVPLPPETMYRIETVKGKLIEFQQSKEGPDYQALQKGPISGQNETELNQTTAIRFDPSQIVHFRIGDDRKTFFPYGQSLIEPARAPAHSLRLMEDAMVVYRLCLVGNTRIRTPDGFKYLKDIKKNDLVYCYHENKQCKETEVLNFINNGIQDVFRVRSKHAEIIGTKTHPILVNRDGVIQYIDIKDLIIKKDKLINTLNKKAELTEIPRILGECWAKLSDEQHLLFKSKIYQNKSKLLKECHNFHRAKQFIYCKNKALPYEKAVHICDLFGLDSNKLLLINKNEYNSHRISLPKYVTEEFAKLFGFLCGDGNIHNNSQLSFSAGIDNKLNLHYSKLLEKFFGKVRFEKDKRSNIGGGKFVVDSTIACKIFLLMGYINDHDQNRIPNWVFKSSLNIKRAFIEGFSNADGCERRTKKGTWFSTIELSNKKMIEDIKEIWSSIGLCSGHIKTRHRKGGHVIYDHIMPDTISHSLTISDYLLPNNENVIEVIPFGKETVYDITVADERHNFIANGIPVHNTRAPERRVFYIDVGQLPPFKAEAFIDRLKDQFRKRKVTSGRNTPGANQVEERWQPPAQDEDYWLPIRPNSNTRIDTLPGAENLGEIDDAIYFRNKLLTSLNFPKNYFNNEDPGATRITLSAQDVKFARMIERLQSHFEDGLLEIAERHLNLRGFPEESYQDLKIKMTAPSDWRELSRAEVTTARFANAGTLKSSQIYSDYDIYLKILHHSEDEADEMLARLKLQKLEDLKLQVLAQNPALMGIGIPGAEQSSPELGTDPGGPSMSPDPSMGGGMPPAGGAPAPMPGGMPPATASGADETPPIDNKSATQSVNIPEPDGEDIKKYDLEITDYEADIDKPSIDYSVGQE